MKTKTKLYAIAVASLIVITAFTFDKRHQDNREALKENYKITNTWKLPTILNEVSGISWVAKDLIACVQDENGVIFMYDLAKKKIVKEVKFAESGDYEGISVSEKDAYIMRSDGLLYKIKGYLTSNPEITKTQTKFVADNNMESLFYDDKNSSILTIPKDRDQDDQSKNIYQIKLDGSGSTSKTIAQISMDAPELKASKNKKLYKTFSPSEVSINPKTKEFFVLEGKRPKLLILGANGQIKKLYELNKASFEQPEGLTFSPDGRMFIANEAGKSGEANILEVVLEE